MKAFRILFRALGIIIGLVIVFLIIATLLAVITDFTPPPHTILETQGEPSKDAVQKSTVSLMTWNIGYGGLGKEMDFFYDGGEMVRPAGKKYRSYIEGITRFLSDTDTLDFILLQEVDKKARRSYRQNQVEKISDLFEGYQRVFARNYDVMFVPVPVNNPMGRVVSGLMNLTVYNATTSERIDYPGGYGFPKRLFMLDRCFIIQRFVTDQGKLLAVVNTHNSAFDDGELRQQEFEFLRKTVVNEYQKGHYVIVGGDWNRNPPGYNPDDIVTGDSAVSLALGNVPAGFMPEGWTWLYDKHAPTNRYADRPYVKGSTRTTIVDYFLVSPNIRPVRVETIPAEFKYSDHQPVIAEVELLD